jgi:hypothetical protein
MRDMASQGTYFSPLLLYSIFFHASKHVPEVGSTCDDSDICHPGRQFRQKAEDLLFGRETQTLCKSSIPTIQALLLMSDTLFSWCDERSLSWHYLGIATNMIIDLGIHSESPPLSSKKSLSPEDVEIRRRVFWSAFGMAFLSRFCKIHLIHNPSLGQGSIHLPRAPSSSP